MVHWYMSSPAVSYVTALLDIISRGYRREDVLTLLKSGLTDIEADMVCGLENYSERFFIRGTKWKKEFVKGGDEEDLTALNEARAAVIDPIMVFASFYVLADFFPDIHIELRDETLLFEYRNKVSRRDHSPVRMHPPYKSFRGNQFSGSRAEDRLIVYNELSLAEGLLHFTYDVVPLCVLFGHIIVKVRYSVYRVRGNMMQSQLSVMQGGCRIIRIFSFHAVGASDIRDDT